ncbi:hypothetical protein WJX73_005741 [Symbiochloris irregularis]|uniref:L-ascorbate peroxidase n=1 Tax=Symbiochloris irregularis TaxID=706552 RepID=A0AAW1PNQ9_9CHLO
MTQARTSRKEELVECKKAVADHLKKTHCMPIMIRLAWHDSGTYDKNVKDWPKCGGATGSIRFYPEIEHAANAGLTAALELLKKIAEDHEHVSYADLFQLASGTAVEVAGGPKIPLRFGRKDADGPESVVPEGNLPAGAGPYPLGATEAGKHLRDVFYRMGFGDKEIVALSGAHTLGRAKPSRSGFGKEQTKYTKDGPGTPGGSSWTPEWLKFDNSYFKEVQSQDDPDLLVLETDHVLYKDQGFRPFAEKYAKDEKLFFDDYVEAHLKLSELGVQWETDPFTLD